MSINKYNTRFKNILICVLKDDKDNNLKYNFEMIYTFKGYC